MGKFIQIEAIKKCFSKLELANEELFKTENSNNPIEYAKHWSVFLTHTGTIYNILEGTANRTAQGRQWFGGVRRKFKSDSLARYLYQSRNVEEHSADPTISIKVSGVGIRNGVVKSLEISDGVVEELETDGPVDMQFFGNKPELLTVVDTRFNTSFPPPKEHGGRAIDGTNPITIGKLYLQFLRKIVEEASNV